jgi:hypothetical protein
MILHAVNYYRAGLQVAAVEACPRPCNGSSGLSLSEASAAKKAAEVAPQHDVRILSRAAPPSVGNSTTWDDGMFGCQS